MAKCGILHDYDLLANNEASANNQTCVVCGITNMSFQWSDYSGEAMCRQCGTPYQLKWGSDEQKLEGKYPYLNLREVLIEPLREYFKQTARFTCLGGMLGPQPGLREFSDWMKANRPEILEAIKAKD